MFHLPTTTPSARRLESFVRISTLLAICFVLTTANAFSQVRRPEPTTDSIELKVRVVRSDSERPISEPVRVVLLSSYGVPVAERFSNDQGYADFTIRPGTYKIRVSGTEDTDEYTGDTFTIYPREMGRYEYVRVPTKPGKAQSANGQINVDELNIPDKARKEFDKGIKSLQDKKYEEANASFKKAVDAYPRYAAAFNNLGVIAMMNGDVATGKQNFEKALSINSKYANANVNMARVYMTDRDYKSAAKYLETAITTEPTNGEAMLLLANANQQLGNFDAVTALSHKLHTLDHAKYSSVHILAGNAFMKSGKPQEAAAEYRFYLKETPESPMAEKVREALKEMDAQGAQAATVAKPQ